MNKLIILFAVAVGLLVGCGTTRPPQTFQIGSATSKNVFVTPEQFANKTVRLRLRNSSGDLDFTPTQLKAIIEDGLTAAGYKIVNESAGIVLDVNLYFVGNVAAGRQRSPNELGALLGAVTGYELTKGSGGISSGSGAILGAIAGATLQDVIRSNNEYNTFVVLCDVNIGVVRQENKKRDSFVIGGSRFERDSQDDPSTYESFAIKDKVKVSVYAGDKKENRARVMQAIQARLGR
ncbi:MAG: complement resistance protein TraT, partial [Burkholderiales bacterium]|nr:complement resistance protein TraT [Burkholderiales bacterium]